MQAAGNLPDRQPRWQAILDSIFLLTWRKSLLVLLLWALTAVFTWKIYDPPDPTILTLIVVVTGAVLIPLYLVAVLIFTIIRTQPRSRYLRLNRYTLLLIPAFLAGVVLHNAVYAMFYPYFSREGGDEGVFFIATTLGIPLYAIALLLITAWHMASGRAVGDDLG